MTKYNIGDLVFVKAKEHEEYVLGFSIPNRKTVKERKYHISGYATIDQYFAAYFLSTPGTVPIKNTKVPFCFFTQKCATVGNMCAPALIVDIFEPNINTMSVMKEKINNTDKIKQKTGYKILVGKYMAWVSEFYITSKVPADNCILNTEPYYRQ